MNSGADYCLPRSPPLTIAASLTGFGMAVRRSAVAAVLLFGLTRNAAAQESGAVRLQALVNGLTVTPRVLLVGAEPGDAAVHLHEPDVRAAVANGVPGAMRVFINLLSAGLPNEP